MPPFACVPSHSSPAQRAPLAGGRAGIEARVARDRARAERLMAVARDLGGDGEARLATLIPESVWSGPARDFVLRDLGASPYEDWNLAFVTTAQEALDAGALPDWPDMERRTAPLAARALERIEADFRAKGDVEAAMAALVALANDIRHIWARHSVDAR